MRKKVHLSMGLPSSAETRMLQMRLSASKQNVIAMQKMGETQRHRETKRERESTSTTSEPIPVSGCHAGSELSAVAQGVKQHSRFSGQRFDKNVLVTPYRVLAVRALPVGSPSREETLLYQKPRSPGNLSSLSLGECCDTAKRWPTPNPIGWKPSWRRWRIVE